MGFYFVSGSHDRSARVWNTDHIQPIRILAGHLSDVDVRKRVYACTIRGVRAYVPLQINVWTLILFIGCCSAASSTLMVTISRPDRVTALLDYGIC